MRLTKNFNYKELCASNTARRLGLKNRPTTKEEEEVVTENLRALCTEVLQPLRDWLRKPVEVSSGYRSEEVNRLVGGVKNSQHLTGEAADIRVDSTAHLLRIMRFIMRHCTFDQLIWEKSKTGAQWVHVSHRREGGNRHQVLGDKNVLFTIK